MYTTLPPFLDFSLHNLHLIYARMTYKPTLSNMVKCVISVQIYLSLENPVLPIDDTDN